ncbi:acyl-CoA dehydrogenase family protein [Micromonospora echinaurantiaca]|uniref:acyl-CoA dehydrogenase family protein n=1 Tax=Micromonospora echinaurantiaca TaxID=47857 RepID=UPI0037B0CFB6
MEFGFTEQQRHLREVTRGYLAERYPPDRVAALADGGGHDPDGWAPLVDLGWRDADLGLVEQAVLADESGYALHPVPWWSTLSAALPGTAPATVACHDDYCATLDAAHRASAVRAVTGPGGWRVSGVKRLVPDLAAVTEVLLTAGTAEGVALFRVRRDAVGVTVVDRAGLDGLRRPADLRCADTPAEPVTDVADTPVALRRLRWRTYTLLAAEALGVARRAYDLAVAHARTRTQFGRPIGAFQGVSFRVADSYVAVELAHSLVYRAAWLAGRADGRPDGTVDEAVAAAVVAARDAAVRGCEHTIQVLGGIGMTWEHPVHRWYRRALWHRAFDAPSTRHRADLARALLGS